MRFSTPSRKTALSFAATIVVLSWLAFAFFPVVPPGWAQTGTTTNAQPAPRKTSQPYTGDLSIFEEKDRGKKLQVERVMDILGIKEGTHVADIGAGSGWFAVRAAKRAGKSGIIYAVDINPESIAYIDRRTQQEGVHNLRTILSEQDDPKLPPGSVDSVLLLKTYHEIAHPVLLLENLRKSLRNGAKIGIIDRNGKGDDHGINEDVVIREAGQAGYQLQEKYDFVKGDGQDYFLVFRANAAPK
ncbi:MAG TPA: methyltransferase domain-containing protein [Candidatus Angelobacter sp.]